MGRDKAYINALTEQIIGSAYAVANSLGSGFLEKVYENALCHDLKKTGLPVVCQYPIHVYYDDIIVGEYFADILVDNEVVVELKAVKSIENVHIAQCLNYLKATRKKVGLLMNFGQKQVQVKRIVNDL